MSISKKLRLFNEYLESEELTAEEAFEQYAKEEGLDVQHLIAQYEEMQTGKRLLEEDRLNYELDRLEAKQ